MERRNFLRNTSLAVTAFALTAHNSLAASEIQILQSIVADMPAKVRFEFNQFQRDISRGLINLPSSYTRKFLGVQQILKSNDHDSQYYHLEYRNLQGNRIVIKESKKKIDISVRS